MEDARTEPKPPFPKQHLEGTGKESELDPRPRYRAPDYCAAGKLKNKVALITGGDSGIGRAVAVLYAREGADVAVVYHSHDEDAEETAAAIKEAGRECVLLKGDVGDPGFCQKAVRKCIDQLGKLDIVVSNAAVQTSVSDLEKLAPEQLEETFRTNVYGYVYIVQAALPHLSPGSSIIATGSVVAERGSGRLPDYSASKGAIHALSRSLAQSLLERGIRVNVVAPGPVWTPLNPADSGMSPKQVSKFGEDSDMERPAQPEEIAPAFVFFASNADSSFVTGQVLGEYGGVI